MSKTDCQVLSQYHSRYDGEAQIRDDTTTLVAGENNAFQTVGSSTTWLHENENGHATGLQKADVDASAF